MEEQFNFDLSFDFLDASTSNVKPNATISTSYPQTANPQVLDVETLASKIASVNDLVLQLKTEKEEHAKIRKQMQDLSESAMSIRHMYEQEKTEKAKHAQLLQEFKDKCELAESQLANKTFHFEQLSSKIEQSAEKGPISYNELTLRYHRLALCLDEDKQLGHKEKQKLQQIQEYMESKKLVALVPFKRKKKQPLENKPEKCDQGTQYSPEMVSKCTFTDIEVIQKKMVSQGTQHTWYTTTRGTNTENQNARKEMKTQGTQYISSTTTRSTSTSGFIKTRSVGTNFPDESTKLVEDIFSEMIYDIRPLSPLAEEEVPPAERVVMKSVGTITGLKNVRKAIDYVTPVNIKSSDSRPPSRNMFERVKNEVPFMGIPTMNSFVEHGGNSSSVPNNITDLWNLLGHTFFSLLQNVNTFNTSMNLNGINDRMRNAASNDEQPRNNGGGSSFTRDYFEEPCRNSSSPQGFLGTTRSTATSPIAELENPTIQEQRFGNEVSCPKVSNPPNAGIADHVNPSTPIEIQKIILNRMFNGETSAAVPSQFEERLMQAHRSKIKKMSKSGNKKSKKRCKSCEENEANANEQSQPESPPSQNSRSQIVTTCTVGTQFNDSNLIEIRNGSTSGNGLRPEDNRSLSLDSLENLPPVNTNLEKEIFGTSDDELSPSEVIPNDTPPAAEPTRINGASEEKSDSDVFCKPFMPKKRKHANSLDTRMFHIEELKAVQQWPVENSSAESKMSKKKAKRKRLAAKALDRFSKVRVCSESAFNNYNEDVHNSVRFVTSCSLNEESPSVMLVNDSYDFSAPATPQSVVLSPSLQAKTTRPEVYKSSECPSFAHKKSFGTVPNETQSGLNPDLNIVFREEVGQMKKTSSEDDNVSAKSSETLAITQQRVSPQCEVISVIDVSLKKPAELIPIQSLIHLAENEKEKVIQNGVENTKTNLPPQISELKMLPLVSTAIQSPEGNSLINELPEKSSVVSKENERDTFEKESNTSCPSSLPELQQMSPEAMKPLCQSSTQSECELETFTSDDSSDQSQQSTSSTSESKWAIPVPYSNQTCNSKNSFENLLLDESNDRFQEIFHQICDEFATPERPVSAIPPCESSDGEDSFGKEINVAGATATVKEKTRKRKGCSAVTVMKRSERLKAKNSIQEAIKYSSLKIPTIELGKYTKKKTEAKSVFDDEIEDKALPSPTQSDQEVTTSECRLGFFKDVFSEEPRVQESSVYAESGRRDLQTQNVIPDSEEDATSDLVIDLEDEANATQVPAEVNLSPEDSKTYHPPEESMPPQPPTSFNFDEPPLSPPPGDREPEADHSPLQVTERFNKHAKTNSLLSQIIVNYNHEYHKKVMNSRKEHDKAIIKQLQTTLTAFAKATCEGEDIIRVVETICCITNCEQLLAHGIITVVKTAPRPETESPTPVPELYLSQILLKVISLLDPLYVRLPNLRTALLTNIEKSIFSFTKDFVTLDMTLNLTQFYLAAIADVDSPSNPARLFICKCLFFYTKKAIPMIYETLCVYPSVLPHRDDPNYDRSDALISTIQCLLMSTYYDTEKSDLKAKQMFHKLRNFYNYECLKPSRDDVIDNLVAKLRAGRFKNVSYSFAIICKRMDQKDIEKTILGERLLPLANEYYQTISATAENDQRIACVLECISYVIKPFPVETDITTYINLFSRFLNATDRQAVQEAALSAVLRTIRFGYVQCFRTIYNFQPKYEMSDETKVMIRSFVYKKTLDYLRKLENQMQVLTQ